MYNEIIAIVETMQDVFDTTEHNRCVGRIKGVLRGVLPYGGDITGEWRFDVVQRNRGVCVSTCNNQCHIDSKIIFIAVTVFINLRKVDKIKFNLTGKFGKSGQSIRTNIYETIKQNLNTL